ncbi:MAG TPA: hypothetical protein VGD59_12390 [Acidisarcina sp.]
MLLFILILFSYERFALWSSPWWTAWLIVAYFVAALAIDGVFKHATFCKYICPIGQFNFIAATVSPLEVRVRLTSVCTSCTTNDCIRGRRDPANDPVVVQRGCELALFQPAKAGNMDCTFCLDCVHACPHDNVGVLSRLPASELMVDPTRSGIGRFSRRKDIAALAVTFTFGALLNAFGMVSPTYVLENWLGRILHLNSDGPVLSMLFVIFLVVEPLVLLGIAAWISQRWAGVNSRVFPLMVRYAYALVPLGFGMWLAHYCFHFFTGLYTIIPVTQSALASIGTSLFGTPRWTWTGLPTPIVQPLEVGFLLLGLAGSLLVAYRLALEDSQDHPLRAFAPWAAVCLLLWAASVWLMQQPMEMRATFMNG